MKIVKVLYIAACLGLTHTAVLHAQGSSADAEKAVIALEEKWTESEKTNKPDQIAPLLADKFMVTEQNGTILDRATFLAFEKGNTYRTSEMKNLKVVVFGDTAIARYSMHQKYTAKGKEVEDRFQETDTWVKNSSGTWQCVAGHASTLGKE